MHFIQREQTRRLLQSQGIETALFAHPHSVTWLTGFAAPVLTGPNPFAGASPMVLYADNLFRLIIVDAFAELAAPSANTGDCVVATYQGYSVDTPIDGAGRLAALLGESLPSSIRGRLGIETADAPATVATTIEGRSSQKSISVDGWLLPLRMIKTQEELDKLRENCRLSDIGQAAARAAVRPGLREIDVWNCAESAIQATAGARVPIGNDCVVGYRQNNVGGWPSDLPIRAGDSVIVDISVVRAGYWSDSCATYFAGVPSQRQMELHRVVSEALALGASLLRPGAVAGDIDRALRGYIADSGFPVYPHHTGHGVGVSGHEAPRIVPYSDEVLAPGMVIMLEPGIYFPGETGVRVEDAFVITEDGAEQWTWHDKTISG